jgi:hypothetical protein
MSRGFSYVYSRPWHFAWYQAVSAIYGWVCVGFVLLFTVMMCYVGVRGAATGFDWMCRWRTENAFGMKDEDAERLVKDRKLYTPDPINVTAPTDRSGDAYQKYLQDLRKLDESIDKELLRNDVHDKDGKWIDRLSEFTERTILLPNPRGLEIVKRHLPALRGRRPDLARLIESGRLEMRTGDSRMYIANDKAWDLVLSRIHTSTELYEWNPRALAGHPHPYGRVMFLLNCSITWDARHGERRVVGIDRTIAGMTPDQLGWGFEIKLTYWIISAWLILAMGLAYGYAVSYFISQQTVIYFLLRKKVDGIEMNEVFEEPEDEEPLPEVAKPADAPKPAEGEKKS